VKKLTTSARCLQTYHAVMNERLDKELTGVLFWL